MNGMQLQRPPDLKVSSRAELCGGILTVALSWGQALGSALLISAQHPCRGHTVILVKWEILIKQLVLWVTSRKAKSRPGDALSQSLVCLGVE